MVRAPKEDWEIIPADKERGFPFIGIAVRGKAVALVHAPTKAKAEDLLYLERCRLRGDTLNPPSKNALVLHQRRKLHEAYVGDGDGEDGEKL